MRNQTIQHIPLGMQQRKGSPNDIVKNMDADEIIQGLLSGKINPNDIILSNPIAERFLQAKEAMGDRLVIASVPKYHTENQVKGVKL